SMPIKKIPQPERPSSLPEGAIDAYVIGEPHAAKAGLRGSGRMLMETREAWPEIISCVLVARQPIIDHRLPLVVGLDRGIADSGKWLDEDRMTGAQHRKDAALVASGKAFYNQPTKLLEYVLLKDVTRVSYTNLMPPKKDFDEIMDLAVELGILPR